MFLLWEQGAYFCRGMDAIKECNLGVRLALSDQNVLLKGEAG